MTDLPEPVRPVDTKTDIRSTPLQSIRSFLHETTCYQILPESFRLIVLDNQLTIKRALTAMTVNSVASAPLYDSVNSKFAGMLTYTDFIHLIQYYYSTASTYDSAATDVESLELRNLREIEQIIGVAPPPTLSIHPDKVLMDASNALNKTHARRVPLVDSDEQTGKETILSVLTQYRLLKFIAINCAQDCAKLTDPIGSLGIGTYTSTYSFANPSAAQSYSHLKASTSSRRSRARSVAQPKAPGHEETSTPSTVHAPDDSPTATTSTADDEDNPYYPLAIVTLSTKIEDVVHMFSELGVSGVPVIDEATGKVLNLYETIDVVDLVRQNAYSNLDLTIEQALTKRSKDFPGVAFCTPEDTLADVLNYIRDKRVHRMVIVNHMTPGSKDGQRLVGMLTLSDVLRYLVPPSDLDPLQLVGLGFQGEETKPEDLSVADLSLSRPATGER